MKTPIYTGIFQSDLDATGYKLVNLPTPVDSGDAANKAYVDAHGGGGGGAGGPVVGIDPKAAPYYASGSATTTTTTGSNASGATTINVVSSSTFSANQGIFIAGAGAAGANYIGTITAVPGATSVTVTPATSTSVGAGAKVQHDDTAAWQAAITALATTGGTIRDSSPGGYYRINGPLQDTGGANCRLKMPNVGPSTGSPIGITIEGAMVPPAAFDSTGIIALISNQGTIIQSESSGGSIIGGYYNDGVYPGSLTNVLLTLRNVVFRTVDNPNQTAINLGNVLQYHIENLTVDTGTNSNLISQPSHANAYGIITSGNNNRSMCSLQNVAVTGYYVGVQWNEHTEITHLLMTQCKVGVEIGFAYHALYGSRIGIFECPRSISAVGAATVYISELDIEWTAAAVWNAKVYDIDDGANQLSGFINWHSVQAYVGIVHSLAVNGGANLSLTEIDTGSGKIRGNVTLPSGASLTIQSGAAITAAAGSTVTGFGGTQTRAVTFVCDGAGSAVSTGTKAYTKIPYGGTITGWTLIGTPSGSVTVDVLRAANGAGLPVTSIIGAGTKPALSGTVEGISLGLGSWTSLTLTAFDNLAISLSGVTSTTYVALTLYFA